METLTHPQAVVFITIALVIVVTAIASLTNPNRCWQMEEDLMAPEYTTYTLFNDVKLNGKDQWRGKLTLTVDNKHPLHGKLLSSLCDKSDMVTLKTDSSDDKIIDVDSLETLLKAASDGNLRVFIGYPGGQSNLANTIKSTVGRASLPLLCHSGVSGTFHFRVDNAAGLDIKFSLYYISAWYDTDTNQHFDQLLLSPKKHSHQYLKQ